MYTDSKEVDINVINQVKNFWPDKFIELHLMSMRPEFWVDKLGKLINKIDMVIFHEDVYLEMKNKIENIDTNIKTGVFFESSTSYEKIERFSDISEHITIMGIKKLVFLDKCLKKGLYKQLIILINLKIENNLL